MMKNPESAWLFLILVPVVALLVYRFFCGRRDVLMVAGRWRGREFYNLYSIKYFFSALGTVVFIAFSILALLGFPGNEYPVSFESTGTDTIFLIDISESMNAEDTAPSRLERAARVVQNICESAESGRFGVVVFKGQGIRIIPLTEDTQTISQFMEQISTSLLTSPGSDIEDGIRKAVDSFTGGEERKKVIMLFSDGEALAGSAENAIEYALSSEVTVYSAGTGTVSGGGIPAADGSFLTDPDGNRVLTRLDEANLRRLSDSTGGGYYNISETGVVSELIRISSGDEISEAEQKGFVIKTRDRYRVFLLIAFAGLMMSVIVRIVKWKNIF